MQGGGKEKIYVCSSAIPFRGRFYCAWETGSCREGSRSLILASGCNGWNYTKKLGNYKVLIIDEWLSYKINERESKFIYELIEQRCGNSPTIFVGQYDVEDWHEGLGGGTQADSI